MHNVGSQIKFKPSMPRSILCDYSDACIHVKGTITVPNTAGESAAVISKINNTKVDDAQYTDVAMPMYNLVEYSNAYSKTSGSLWQYYREVPALDNNHNIIDFPANNNNSIFSKFKQQITGQTRNGDTKDVEIMVPLKYLSNFWRTIEIPLINCEISLQSKDCFLVAGTAANQEPEYKVTDTKLYVPAVTLSTQDYVKQLKQLESGFKRTINWNTYLSKTTNEVQNRYLDYLIDLSFPGVNRLFVLSFTDENGRESYKQYHLPTVEMKGYNVMIDGRNLFDQPMKNDLKPYDNVRKIATGQGDDCTTGCLLDYPYFKKHYKLVATDLSKQQKIDADP